MTTPPPIVDRTATVAAAAARDVNDELTLILSALSALESDDDEARALLCDVRAAAQRVALTVGSLMDFAATRGGRATAASSEQVVEQMRTRWF